MSAHPIYEYFSYDEATKKSKCLIINCPKPFMSGKHAYNLQTHLKRRHRHLIPQLDEKLLCYSKRKTIVKKNIKATKIMIKISREDFLMGYMEMVTINGRPFSTMKDSGLRRIFDPIQSAFERENISVHTYPEKLQAYAKDAQNIVKNKIKAEMTGKLISLQLDLTTHLHRCILGVNAQFSIENDVVIRVLGMKRHLLRTSSINLALEVEKILKEYDLDVDDIYTHRI